MEWPCGKCPEIADRKYAHYYGYCDDCPKVAEYEEWETKQHRNFMLQKGKRKGVVQD